MTTPGETGMKLSQFFATGQAANTLATDPDVVKLFNTSLGVTPLLKGNPPGNCDAACVQIGTFVQKDPVKNLAVLKALCPSMAAEKESISFQYAPQRAADRADCAARLPA